MRERMNRFDQYMKEKGLNDNQVTSKCGLSQGLLGQARTGKSDLGNKTIDKILNFYQDLNKVWLLTGEGDMLNDEYDTIGGLKRNEEEKYTPFTIPLLPVSAQGGSLNDFVVSVKESDCERIISPIKDAEYAMSVSGDSMSPEYPSGSQILIKRINEKAFIDWGRTYVLDTCNGTVIKRLFPTESKDRVICKSINPEYPPFEVCLADVYGVYRVLMCMSLK